MSVVEGDQEIKINSIGMRFKFIPAGSFMMGSEEWRNSRPVHKVIITKPFYIGICQVTQREWGSIVGTSPSHFKGDNLPVEMVSWDECQGFIALLNKKEGGLRYRLPTEAEWEFACRAGSNWKYCFGDEERRLFNYGWFVKNSDGCTHPVGTKAPNAWGLRDMHGNVLEWCHDWYDRLYYYDSPKSDPLGPSHGMYRVVRGGSWGSGGSVGACAARSYGRQTGHSDGVGFRLVMDLQ